VWELDPQRVQGYVLELIFSAAVPLIDDAPGTTSSGCKDIDLYFSHKNLSVTFQSQTSHEQEKCLELT
jgi:hypothetical protein